MNKTGLIYSLIGGNYFVVTDDKELYKCKARGKFRNIDVSPVVGDNVVFEVRDGNEGYLLEVMERSNFLYRPKVSNVDYGLIVTSVVSPKLSLYLLDKMIVLLEMYNVKPIILLTKTAGYDQSELAEIIEYYNSIGYKVFTSPNSTTIDLDMVELLNFKTTIVLGQTGVGKSTFINNLDSTLNITTNEISKALGRGKHTTRHTQIYFINDIRIVDSPGFSSLEFKSDVSAIDIAANFVEFYEMSANCKYSTCIHHNEPKCFVKESLKTSKHLENRYASYLKIISELKGS